MLEICWQLVRVALMVMGLLASVGVLVLLMYLIVFLTEDD